MFETFRQLVRQHQPDPFAETSSFEIETRYSTPTSASRQEWDKAVVLSVARGIEPNADRALRWFTKDPIRELDGKTAWQLVEDGATARLLDMLIAIRSGQRDD